MIKVNLLWTGGLDSTFRLVELAHEQVEIQPVYIIPGNRRSAVYEQRAMARILSALREKPFVKGRIRDVLLVEERTIADNQEITEAYRTLASYNGLGSQYDILARFADQHDMILEVGLEKSERSKAAQVLNKFGALERDSYLKSSKGKEVKWSDFLAINPKKADKNAVMVFKNLRFPAHLYDIEKVDEAQLLRSWGCEDILKSTWFCHDPVFGYPCGRCNPCKDALNEGMGWRVPMIGQILGFGRYVTSIPRRAAGKLIRIIKK